MGAYPVEFLVRQVGGDRVTVRNVAAAGVEPHDLELSPRDVAAIGDADLVVTLKGFQPGLDAASESTDARTFDLSLAAALEAEPGADADEQVAYDPHFWLDPMRMAQAGAALADQLIAVDPEGRDTYRGNVTGLRIRLLELHGEFQRGLAQCRSRDLVTAHDAFGYLASRYNLRERPIAGLDSDMEPSPAALAEIANYVREHDVATVYAEVHSDERVARTVTQETGAKLAALDTVETFASDSPGDDYLTRMRGNLAVLREGQGCR